MPILGWKNYDNSLSIKLARLPLLFWVFKKIGILTKEQEELTTFAMKSDIKYADATKHIPESNHSVDVLYSSHMFEHLDRDEACIFLKEASRILRHGGIIRLSVPDLDLYVTKYVTDKDVNKFMESIFLAKRRPKTFLEKIKYVIVGDRCHQWMYSGKSLCDFLSANGFDNPQIMKNGETNILNVERLDLFERNAESVYVEAFNP
jgi:predicted SAM-dependent methyltransferase